MDRRIVRIIHRHRTVKIALQFCDCSVRWRTYKQNAIVPISLSGSRFATLGNEPFKYLFTLGLGTGVTLLWSINISLSV